MRQNKNENSFRLGSCYLKITVLQQINRIKIFNIMHDTSTQSMSKWKAVGAKRNESSILSPSATLQAKKESRKYRPSKQKDLSNSKIFNRSRSHIQSLDNIPKEDLNDSHIKEASGYRTRRLTKNSEQIKAPIVRVNSESAFLQTKDLRGTEGVRGRKVSVFGTEKQLIVLKEDYNKFKQKILAQLEIQKQNIHKFVNEILQTVRTQLMAIEQKYAKSSNIKQDQSIPVFSTINIPQFNGMGSKLKLTDISTINNIPQGQMSRTPSEKAIISELTSLKTVEDDPITQRFSKFYSAIQKLKSDLDCLHEISAVNKHGSEGNGMSHIILPSHSANLNGHSKGYSPFLKT